MNINLTDTIEIGGVVYTLRVDDNSIILSSGFNAGIRYISLEEWETLVKKIKDLLAKTKKLKELLEEGLVL